MKQSHNFTIKQLTKLFNWDLFNCLIILGFVTLFNCLIVSAYGFADLSEVGIGARPLSLGRAYTALSSDGSGVFVNPAGLSDFPKLKLVSMTGKLIEDVNYFSIGAAQSFPLGTIGIGYISAGSGAIPLTTLTHTSSMDVISDPYAFTDYASSILYLSYSRKLKPNFSLGSSLKFFNQNFSLTSGSMEGAAGSGMEADLGFKFIPQNFLSLAANLKNALPSNWGGKFTWQKNKREESIPLTLNLGANLRLFGPAGFRQFRDQNVSILLDAQTQPNLPRQTLFRLGCEWWISSGMALRAGVDQDFRASAAGGTEIENNLSFGVGLRAAAFTFDYAFHQYGELQANVSHFFSMGYIGYDEDEQTALFSPLKEKEGLSLITNEKKPLKHFKDVGALFWAKDAIEYLAALQIMEGNPDGTFSPEGQISRSELGRILSKTKEGFAYKEGKRLVSRGEGAAILARFAGLYVPKRIRNNPYPDVDKNLWCAPAVAMAKEAGLLEFIGEGDFKPDKPLTRAEAAEIISKTRFGRERIEKFLKGSKN